MSRPWASFATVSQNSRPAPGGNARPWLVARCADGFRGAVFQLISDGPTLRHAREGGGRHARGAERSEAGPRGVAAAGPRPCVACAAARRGGRRPPLKQYRKLATISFGEFAYFAGAGTGAFDVLLLSWVADGWVVASAWVRMSDPYLCFGLWMGVGV